MLNEIGVHNWEACCSTGQQRDGTLKETRMDTMTVLIIILVVVLLGGGWFGRGRWY
jgi:hypothetical protein